MKIETPRSLLSHVLLVSCMCLVCHLPNSAAGTLDHFSWEPIHSPQQVQQAFPVTVTARDASNQVVTNFTGPINLFAREGNGIVSSPILGDLSYQSFSYNQNGPVSAGYDFTPNTDITVTHVRAYSGGRISIWTTDGVLLAAREVNDFGGRWVETPLVVPLRLSAGTTYRVTLWSGSLRYYWRTTSVTSFAHGLVGSSYVESTDIFPTHVIPSRTWLVDLRYSVGNERAVPITPSSTGTLQNGSWSGTLSVLESASALVLNADDGAEHKGDSAPIEVLPPNDLNLSVSTEANSVPVNNPFTYTITVSNTGPAQATGVQLTNSILGPVALSNIVASQGTFWIDQNRVICALGAIGGGAAASVRISLIPTNSGLGAIQSTVARGELDAWYDNNSRSLVTSLLPPPPISIVDASVIEPDATNTNVSVTVLLGYATCQAVSVDFATTNGSATAGLDYLTTSGRLVFNPGVTNLTLSIPIIGDSLNEPSETFYVNLSNATNAQIARAQGVVTILDNDSLPAISIADANNVLEGNSGTTNALFSVTLSAASGRTVTVRYQTTNGTAIAGSDYTLKTGTLTFAPGATNLTISVSVIGDVVGEANENFYVNLINPTNATLARSQGVGTILNDDPLTVSVDDTGVLESTNPVSASFRVWISWPGSNAIDVAYSTANGTALAGQDYVSTSGLLTFPPGVTTQFVQVTILGNTINEANEDFSLFLTGATNATIADNRGVCVITNNIAAPVVSSVSSPTVLEGDVGQTNAVFQISLSAPSQQLIPVAYVTGDGSATAGSDYVSQSGSLLFSPGTTNLTVSVPVLGDRVVENNETFTLLAGGVTGVATIVNDDGLPGNARYFEWSPISSPQLVGQSFPVSVTARDYFNNVATNFSGPVTVLAWSNSPTARLFQEDFEDGALDGWSPSFVTVDRYFTNQFAAAGTNCLYLGMNDTSHSLSNLTPSRVNFSVRASSQSGNKCYFVTGTSSYAADAAAYFYMSSGGQMGLYVDGYGLHSSPYQSNVWYKISLLFHWQSRTIDYLVNDALVETNIPFRSGTVNSLTTVYLSGNSASWFDQIEFIGDGTVDASQAVTPLILDTFTNGIWTGSFLVSAPSTNMVLGVTNSDGFVGFSNPFQVAYPDDLSLSMQADHDVVYVGDDLNYSVKIGNTGPDEAMNVVVTNTLPPTASFVSAAVTRGGWTRTGQTLTWNPGTLAPGGQETLNLTVRPTTPGFATNSAAARMDALDPDLPNNSAATVSQVLPALHHFNFSNLPTNQASDVPMTVALTARDANNNLISNYSGTVSLTATRLFKEDFEDGNLDGWTAAAGTSGITITNTLGGVENNALNLSGSLSENHFFPLFQPSELRLKARISSAWYANIFCLVESGDSENQRIVDLMWDQGIMTMFGGNGTFTRPFSTDRWYQIRFVFDWPARRFDWYVDGSLVASNIAFYGSNTEGVGLLSLVNWINGSTWWDEIEFIGAPASNDVLATPNTLGPFANGSWVGTVNVGQVASNVQLRVSDSQNHWGLSRTLSVGPGPRGVFDHVVWGPVADCLVNEPFPATLIAEDAFGDVVTNFNGAVPLRAVQQRNPRVLVFSAYASPAYAQGPVTIISNAIPNAVFKLSTNTDPGALREELRTCDAFIIAAQDAAPAGILAPLSAQWAPVLVEFVENGGTLISLAGGGGLGASGAAAWVNDSGLLSCALQGIGGPVSLTNSTHHILTKGIQTPFQSPSTISYFFNTNGTPVLGQLSGEPIVLCRDVGFGHALIFGSAMSGPSGTALDTVFANAVKWAQSSGLEPLPLTPTLAGSFTNGTWTGNLVISDVAENAWLQGDAGSLNPAFSNPFSVGVINDIGLTMSLSNNLVVVGTPLSFDLVVTNAGPNPATAVRLTNSLPAGTSFIGASSSRGVCSLVNGDVICDIGELAGGEAVHVIITASADQTGLLTNLAAVGRGEMDFYPGNNTASVVVPVFPPPTLYANNTIVLEGDTGITNAIVQITLYPPSGNAVSVEFATFNGTALAGVDYVATNGVLTFPPGVTNRTLAVGVIGDLVSEDTEWFGVHLSNPTNAGIGITDGVASILDNNDPLPLLRVDPAVVREGDAGTTDLVFQVGLSTSSGRTVSVHYATSDGTASSGSDFEPTNGVLEIAPGTTNGILRVTAHGDTVNEPDEFFFMNLTDVSNAILAYSFTSGVLLNDDAVPGKLDHFAFSAPSVPLLRGQPARFTLTARDAWNYELPEVQSAFNLACSSDRSTNAVEVLMYTRCVDSTRYPGTLTAISNWFTAFNLTTTTTLDPALLEAALWNKDVLLIPAQNCGTGFWGTLGTSWSSALNRFVARGGKIIVCSDNYDEYLFLANSGLLQLTRIGNDMSGAVTNTHLSRLTEGVSNSFSGPFVSTYVASNGIVALRTASAGYAVVVQRDIGAGAVFMIGGGFFSTGSPMDHVLANAVAWSFANGVEAPRFTADAPLVFTDGSWTGLIQFENSGTNLTLLAFDDQGHSGSASPIQVLDDSDGDGMPDDWERAHGLNPLDPSDAAGDADGDGMSNLAEFLAGTDPQSAANRLQITSFTFNGTSWRLQFSSVSGRRYAVEATEDPGRVPWTTLDDTLVGNGGTVEYLFTSEQAPRCYYRVRIVSQ